MVSRRPGSETIRPIASAYPAISVGGTKNPVTPSSYRVTGIPTLNLYQGGEVVKSIVGARPKAALLNELSDYISN